MRMFELMILVFISILPFTKQIISTYIKPKNIAFGLLFIFLMHLIIEGWRWQMMPAYLMVLGLVSHLYIVQTQHPFKLSVFKVLGFLGILLLLGIAWFLPMFLPVFKLPATTGTYNVATQWIHLKTDMDETITEKQGDTRSLMVKVWYPTETNTGATDLYVDQGNRLGFIQKYSMGILPEFAIDYLDRVQTNVYVDAPVAPSQFPILFFSPGYGSMSTGYYALLSELASHGYVIFNLTHTYESLGTTFPEGQIKLFDYGFQHKQNKGAMKHIRPLQDAFKQDLSFNQRLQAIKEASEGYHVANMVERWSDDIIYVMNQVNNWNEKGFLKDRLTLNKMGVFGHSRGGGAAGQVTIKDNRISAAANIDGVQWGKMIDTIFHKPFLNFSSDWPPSHENVNPYIYAKKSTDYFYEAKLLKSGHSNFMDIPFMVPFRSLSEAGEIEPYLGMRITRELVTTFFDRHLKNDSHANMQKVKDEHDLLELATFAGDSIR